MQLRRILQISLLASLSRASMHIVQPAEALARRQDDSKTDSTASNTMTASNAASSASQTQDSSSSNTNSASNGDSSSKQTTSAPKDSNSKTSTASPALTTAKTIAQNAPAGGISLISPAAQTTAYYKIGEPITFVWNYTSLLAPPTAIDILVSCTASTYTLTQNASVAPTGTYTWDTGAYENQQNPLVNAFYTLGVYDAASAYTAVPSPGHLANNGLQSPFGIYATQTPSVTNILECVTCSGGARGMTSGLNWLFLLAALGLGLFMG